MAVFFTTVSSPIFLRETMAYDEMLGERIRRALKNQPGIAEKKMFGGLAFLVRGNMCCGVVGSDLMLRLGNEGAAAALTEPHTRPMDFTGRPLKSMIYVEPEGIARDEQLWSWLRRVLDFAETLPAKKPQKAKRTQKEAKKEGTTDEHR